MNRNMTFLSAVLTLGATLPPVLAPLLAQPASTRGEPRARYLGSISCRTPAMTFLRPLRQGEREALIVCSFGMLGRDAVRVVPEPGARLSLLDRTVPELLTDEVVWPNEALPAPSGALDFEALTVAGGFLVPGKNPGAVVLLPLPRGGGTGRMHPLRVTTERAGWFYHRAEWLDVNGDGRLDLLTARARKTVGRPGQGELLWLEQPEPVSGSAKAVGQPWEEHVLLQGPDVHFRTADLDGDGRREILTTQFFSRRLGLHWFEPKTGEAGAAPQLASRILDGRIGEAFDLEVTDLNADGKPDLLVTNHEPDEQAAVFAYEIPSDFRQAPWPRRTLLSGIQTRQRGINSASPGAATAFHPVARATREKPWILVSGDGSQRAHLLRPLSRSPEDWSYEESTLADTQSTVGTCAVGDTDGDGCAEVFVPAYNRDRIFVYTFAR